MSTGDDRVWFGRYWVRSIGNGWAYEFGRADVASTFWVQDEDAQRFNEQVESAWTSQDPEAITAGVFEDYMGLDIDEEVSA